MWVGNFDIWWGFLEISFKCIDNPHKIIQSILSNQILKRGNNNNNRKKPTKYAWETFFMPFNHTNKFTSDNPMNIPQYTHNLINGEEESDWEREGGGEVHQKYKKSVASGSFDELNFLLETVKRGGKPCRKKQKTQKIHKFRATNFYLRSYVWNFYIVYIHAIQLIKVSYCTLLTFWHIFDMCRFFCVKLFFTQFHKFKTRTNRKNPIKSKRSVLWCVWYCCLASLYKPQSCIFHTNFISLSLWWHTIVHNSIKWPKFWRINEKHREIRSQNVQIPIMFQFVCRFFVYLNYKLDLLKKRVWANDCAKFV